MILKTMFRIKVLVCLVSLYLFFSGHALTITGVPLPTPSPSPVPLLPRGPHLPSAAPGSMAALAPPPREEEHARLTLSDQKIFKYGSYWMRLEISRTFRTVLGLSDDDIIEAGLNVRCKKVGKPQGSTQIIFYFFPFLTLYFYKILEVAVCVVCNPDKPAVAVLNALPKSVAEDGETELFRFPIKSNCTSSRYLHQLLNFNIPSFFFSLIITVLIFILFKGSLKSYIVS